MARPTAEWRSLQVGDMVRLRPKRSVGARIDVVVHVILDRHYANGHGFEDESGQQYSQWFFDLEFRFDAGIQPDPVGSD